MWYPRFVVPTNYSWANRGTCLQRNEVGGDGSDRVSLVFHTRLTLAVHSFGTLQFAGSLWLKRPKPGTPPKPPPSREGTKSCPQRADGWKCLLRRAFWQQLHGGRDGVIYITNN